MEITFWLNVEVRYKKVPPPPLNQINIILKIWNMSTVGFTMWESTLLSFF